MKISCYKKIILFLLAPGLLFVFAPLVSAQYNTAYGDGALANVTTGISNSAFGFNALLNDTTGDNNTGVGGGALASNTAGGYNVAVGTGALGTDNNGFNNVAVGFDALSFTIGSGNIALGYVAGDGIQHGNNNVMIGNVGMPRDSGIIRIGARGTHVAAFIAGISDTTIASGVPVVVTSKGQLGVATSSARFKDNIQPMMGASDAILSLQPVSFRYKKEIDSSGIPQFGLVAEDVAKVDPDLVLKDEAGKPYTVRYEAVNAMLLNEFLKEHRAAQTERAKVATLESEETQLQKTVADLQAALKAQAAQIQKVSAQLKAGAARE